MTASQSSAEMSRTQPDGDVLAADPDQARGWYLYGIIRQPQPLASASEAEGAAVPLDHETEDIQVLQHAGLGAVVRSVVLADYAPEAIRARAQDASWLELMATHHHEVVESVHRMRPILPATFGCVYPDAGGLRAALGDMRDALIARLEQVAGCDEWTVRLYADPAALRQHLLRTHPQLQQAQRAVSDASAGRAYLLKRKLADELAGVMERATRERAGREYERISRTARASAVQEARYAIPRDHHGAMEVLRAVFLVPRQDLTAFLDEVDRIAQLEEGTRGECSGPWPPYSFASIEEVRDAG